MPEIQRPEGKEPFCLISGVPVYAGDRIVVPSKLYHSIGSDWATQHHAMQIPPASLSLVYETMDEVVETMRARLREHGAGCLTMLSKSRAREVGLQVNGANPPKKKTKAKQQLQHQHQHTAPGAAHASSSSTSGASSTEPPSVPALAPTTGRMDPLTRVGDAQSGQSSGNLARSTDAAIVPEAIAWP